MAVAAIVSLVVPHSAVDSRTSAPLSAGGHRAPVAVRKGVSCGPLRQSQTALESGDIAALRNSIRAAVHLAVESLKKGSMAFGRPERISLKLSSEHLVAPLSASQKTHVAGELKSALVGCPAIHS
ncbi:MAG: hypothetical protein QOH48_209 [Actinomycetota bacterium]|nr:hypothetical protein [Actinomycetota bacterium]